MNKEELYFKNDTKWREWLSKNYDKSGGIYLIFYKIETGIPSMRWEEAVNVALCFGWIDSTVKSLGDGKRRQYFCPRKPKSAWSKLNKSYVEKLLKDKLMHESGLNIINIAKENGSWTALDDVENLIVPEDLQAEFDQNSIAYKNYQKFSPSYRKGYLYWLNNAKRKETRNKRIREIIKLCETNIKSKGNW